jgi:hypothetical protein
MMMRNPVQVQDYEEDKEEEVVVEEVVKVEAAEGGAPFCRSTLLSGTDVTQDPRKKLPFF